MTGKFPFEGKSAYSIIMKHVHEPLVPVHEVVNEAPPELSVLIETMMAKKPEDRFQSVEDILPDLLTFFLGSGLYSVSKNLTPVGNSSIGPAYGTGTRVLINAARKIAASSRLRDQADKKGTGSDDNLPTGQNSGGEN